MLTSNVWRSPTPGRARQIKPRLARDLSVSYARVGDVLVAQGKLQEALEAYQQSLAIEKPGHKTKSAQSGNTKWRRARAMWATS